MRNKKKEKMMMFIFGIATTLSLLYGVSHYFKKLDQVKKLAENPLEAVYDMDSAEKNIFDRINLDY